MRRVPHSKADVTSDIESYLCGAAAILRGLTDTGDEDTAAAADYALATANDRLAIPDGVHWNDAREAPRNVGRAIEAANQQIQSKQLTLLADNGKPMKAKTLRAKSSLSFLPELLKVLDTFRF